MSLAPFESLPDGSRLWCFASTRELAAPEAERLRAAMEEFVARWTAHRKELRAGFEWLYGRFLLVAVDESAAGASGCSIDALMGHLRALGADLDTDFLDSQPIWMRAGDGRVARVTREEFSTLSSQGRVSGSTTVFDLTLTELSQYREGRLEAEAARSWHHRLLTPA